ncbi:MAG: UDP-N-acetylmuramate dehydrogenase [bacterium]
MNITDKIQKDVLIAPMTTFEIGGPAKFFVEVETKDELTAAVAWAKEQQEKIYILAGGSNVLINDAGVNGLVIKMKNKTVEVNGQSIICGAGAMLGTVIATAVSNSLSGLEWGAGIPGTVGGAVRGNAGAYGGDTSGAVAQVEVFDLEKLEFVKLSREDCKFSYRHSWFKDHPNYVIWQAEFVLQSGDREKIMAEMSSHVSSRACGQPKYPSAGCAFKNLFADDLKTANPELYRNAVENNLIKGGKVGCGRFIDQLGIKGKRIGGAMVSQEHGNFIVNVDNATADDVAKLISYVKQQVRDKHGIQLEEEVQYFGFE